MTFTGSYALFGNAAAVSVVPLTVICLLVLPFYALTLTQDGIGRAFG